MKFVKMSLAAALLTGASAFAIDNVKVAGDAKLFYITQDSDAVNAPDMFDKDASAADVALHVGMTADLTENVSAGLGVTAVSTLGLENSLVSGTWSNAHGASSSANSSFLAGSQVDDALWVDEAWIAATAMDTTLKLGRMELDTPLAFTENWGIDKNTFEAGVVINESIPKTALIAAWVGKSNGAADDQVGTLNGLGAAKAGYVATDGRFSTFAKDGAYVFGLKNNSVEEVELQAWYYSLQKLATAYWLQADANVAGLTLGGQYANVDVDGATDTDAYAVKVGYEMKDVAALAVGYSSVDNGGTLGVNNVASGSGFSALYTDTWWNFGAGNVGTDTIAVTAEATVAEIDLFAGYWMLDTENAAGTETGEVDEISVVASKSYGPLDTSVAVSWVDTDDKTVANADSEVTYLQVYLTYNF